MFIMEEKGSFYQRMCSEVVNDDVWYLVEESIPSTIVR